MSSVDMTPFFRLTIINLAIKWSKLAISYKNFHHIV